MENQRGVVLTFIVGAVAIGIFVRSLARTLMLGLVLEDPVFAGYFTLSWIVGILGGIVGFFVLMRNQKVISFTDEVITELGRVHWPSREETLNNTGIVVGAALFFSSLLAVYDFSWAKITEYFLYSSG